jgi:hypothetical protein
LKDFLVKYWQKILNYAPVWTISQNITAVPCSALV